MKKTLRRFAPQSLTRLYHYAAAWLGALWYGFPSRNMVVIGVTGTKGKTSSINFIWACLSAGGYKTGIISTANIRIGENESLNAYHMTMPGRSVVQQLMSQMVKEGCTHCVVETTSEGIQQYRHVGIRYDVAVFTNLFPEHLESHGSFENYRRMKRKLFEALSSRRKVIGGNVVPKVIVANRDDSHCDYFLEPFADTKLTFGLSPEADVVAEDIQETEDGILFSVSGTPFRVGIPGAFNVYNALPAIALARLYNIDDAAIARGLRDLHTIPGRMEKIEERQPFTVFVDYAHEKQSMTNVLRTAQGMRKDGRTIVLLGAEGGGRDKAKRPVMGELAARLADYVVVCNVDPYDDDPQQIIEDIAVSAERHGKIRGANLFAIQDRREGIRKALSLARGGDIVLITGKGAEQSMVVRGESIPWDDRTVVREELRTLVIES